jgi:hypothetical protein
VQLNRVAASNAAIKQMPKVAGLEAREQAQPDPGEAGQQPDGNVQILDGLVAGDEVVIHSERDLNEGARIKVVSQLVGKPK